MDRHPHDTETRNGRRFAEDRRPSDARTRRYCLRMFAGGATVALCARAALAEEAAPAGAVSVREFGADPSGQRDSSEAFAQAIAKSDSVTIPEGTYLVGDVKLRTHLTLAGRGEGTILRQKPGARFALTCDSGSPDLASNLTGLVIKDLQLRGSCDTEGFSEFIHLLSLNGVTDASLSRVVFRGFRGDGLYIGSSNDGKAERHNLRVTVRDCVFDGINNENRNGISVIDCDGLVVEKCRFVNVSRANMPGAIDLEPNASAFHVIRNVRIAGNTFQSIGGGVGTVSMYISTALAAMPKNIVVEDNMIRNANSTAFSFMQNVPPSAGAPSQGIVVRRNQVSGKYQRPFVMRGVVGVELSDNRFSDATQSALIGYREARDVVREMTLRSNVFERCGSEGGVGVSVFTVKGLAFVENEWKDCGNGKPNSYAVDFNLGTSERVSFTRNRFLSPNGRTAFAVQKEAAHRFDAGANEFVDNVVDTRLRNAFDAGRRSDHR